MKKYLYFFTAISILLGGCSSDDSGSGSSNDDDDPFKFEIQDGLKFSSKIPNEDTSYGSSHSKRLNNNGTTTHTISGFPNRFGNNPLFLQDNIVCYIEFTLPGDIQINQIIPINELQFSWILPYKDTDNFSLNGNACDRLELENQSSSTGYLKITNITSDYIYGEFEFNNLVNVGGSSQSPVTCVDYPSQLTYNIINGSIQALKI